MTNKKVLFIPKFISHYRVEFYDKTKEALAKHNVEVNVVYGKPKGEDALKKDEADIKWGKFVPTRWFKIGKTQLIWQPYFRYIKGNDLVIVTAENKLLFNYYLIVKRKFSNFKLAFWGHGRNMQDRPDSIPNRFKSYYLNKCDWWFAYTTGVKDIITRLNFPVNKITVVQNAIDTLPLKEYYNAIDDEKIKALKDKLGISGAKTGIYCGGIYPDKRIDFLLEACFRIKKEIPDFHMIFIGSGIEVSKITEAAKTAPWIHYMGTLLGNDRVPYFKISSIQLMPGLVGLGILDSFAMETPIITTQFPFHSPEIDYLENGSNGIITENTIDAYADTVIDLLKNEKYLKLINGCKASSEKYTMEAMVENFTNGILSCLNQQ
ncbi:MAG: glycosyltransferase family 4 protein [Chitinophagaceae bacterium]